MVTNRKSIQDYLKEFDFEELFVDELGWNRLRNKERPFTITCKGQEIYNYPLQEGARDTLNRQIRSDISDYELAQLVVRLRDDNLLCHIQEETEPQEPQILCSLGLFEATGGA